MRLTMLTRHKISLPRAAFFRTTRETAHGLNDRKQRGWVEAGILPLNYSRSITAQKYSKDHCLAVGAARLQHPPRYTSSVATSTGVRVPSITTIPLSVTW